jgi:hypothetical protein
MKSNLALLSALCLLALNASAAESVKSESPASAPGVTATPNAGKAPPKGVSAVDAANSAQEPGKVRPAHEVVPQIVVPLRNGKADAEGGGEATGGHIDQEAARCAAQKTRSERRICKAKRR